MIEILEGKDLKWIESRFKSQDRTISELNNDLSKINKYLSSFEIQINILQEEVKKLKNRLSRKEKERRLKQIENICYNNKTTKKGVLT